MYSLKNLREVRRAFYLLDAALRVAYEYKNKTTEGGPDRANLWSVDNMFFEIKDQSHLFSNYCKEVGTFAGEGGRWARWRSKDVHVFMVPDLWYNYDEDDLVEITVGMTVVMKLWWAADAQYIPAPILKKLREGRENKAEYYYGLSFYWPCEYHRYPEILTVKAFVWPGDWPNYCPQTR